MTRHSEMTYGEHMEKARNITDRQEVGETMEPLMARFQEIIEKAAEEDLKRAQVLASGLEGSELNIVVKIGDEGQLFESINSQKIVEKLKEMGFEVKKSQVKLENPIKETGEFPINIKLDHNLEAEIKVIITAGPEATSKDDLAEE